jgi:type III restriction enzyme
LFRNEQIFKIYNFSDGEPFYPDFVLFLRKKETKQEFVYQIFIEPKGDQFLDANNAFEQSKEGWKEELLLQIEKSGLTTIEIENKDFRLIGLPFYNEGKTNKELHKKFEEMFENKLLK